MICEKCGETIPDKKSIKTAKASVPILKSKIPTTSRGETKPVPKVTMTGFDRPPKEITTSADKLSLPRNSEATIQPAPIEVPAIYKRIIPGLGAPLFEENRAIMEDKSVPVPTPKEEKKKPVVPAKPVKKSFTPAQI
jgi:hypothetical protein